MGFLRALFVGGAETDRGAASDQGRPALLLGLLERGFDSILVMAVDADRVPARRPEARALVLAGREARRAVDGDAVVVPHHNQLGELEVTRKIDRLVADAFHQAAVAADHIGVMIDEVGAVARGHRRFRDRHADRHREALAQRPGRRFDARRVAVFGVAGGLRTELAKALDLLDRHVGIAKKIERGVEQHRAVSSRKHEAVAIWPMRS